MTKKIIVGALIILATLFPVTKALAVVPALLLFVAPAVESTFVPWVAGIAATGVAALAGWLMLQDPEKPTQTPITIQLDPNKPLITPPGWTSPTTPPSTSSVDLKCPEPSSDQAECANFGACVYSRSYTYTSISSTQCQGYVTNSNIGANNAYNVQQGTFPTNVVNKFAGCQTGYTANGQNCILSSPADVKKPPQGKDTIKRDGNSFVRDPQQNPDDNNPKVQVSPNKITYTNENGEKVEISLNPTTGGTTVTHSTPDPSTGTTKVNSSDISPSGAVTGGSQQTYQGTGTQQTTTPSANTSFPNDYARAGEAQNAANSTNAKLDPLTSMTGAADGSAELPIFSEGFSSSFNGISGWQLPTHSSNCPTAHFDVWDHEFNLDSQCDVFDQVKAPLSISMIAVWVVMALFIVLGA